MEDLDDGSRRYNLGNGSGFSVKEVIETAREVTGHEIPTIRSELGWGPRFAALRSIIETAWRWHSPHPEGYRS